MHNGEPYFTVRTMEGDRLVPAVSGKNIQFRERQMPVSGKHVLQAFSNENTLKEYISKLVSEILSDK